MLVRTATDPGHAGRANEDFVGAVASAAVLVDGAGIRDAEHICRHGVAWYAHRLGGTLLALLSLDEAEGDRAALTSVLARAIDEVTGLHRDTCDVQDPSSPSATVAVVRVAGGRVDHLVLGDSVVVLGRAAGSPVVIEDRREVDIARPWRSALAGVAPGSREHDRIRSKAVATFRASRNQPGGFWVAKDDGRVVSEALAGSRDAVELAHAVLLSNGASRVVDRFGIIAWHELTEHEPADLIRMVREAERAGAVEPDDATAAICSELVTHQPLGSDG